MVRELYLADRPGLRCIGKLESARRDTLEWCRGAELNCLRRPFQGRALPVSYLGTGTI